MTTTAQLRTFSSDAFKDRVYGVTGGAHGIGEATVKALCALGARVVLIDIDREHLDRVEEYLKHQGATAICIHADIATEGTLAGTIDQARQAWGRVDGWVSNAMHNATRRCASSSLTPKGLVR